MDSNKNRRKKIVQDQSSHVWRHAGRCVHCSAVALNLFGRRQQLIKNCEQDNFTGTVCNSARGVGLVFDQKKTYTLEPIHDEPMSRMWREERGTCLLMKTTFVSQETSLENIVGFGWGLSLMMLQCMPYMGLCFFQHPRIGQFLGEPCCFLLNYSALGRRMTTNLVWIWSAWRHLSKDV